MRVVIVGAGFGGVGAAIELNKHGFGDVTLLERAPALGGTWHYNTYPGAACDVPSHLYSYSFAPRRHWSRHCSPQPEILSYLQEVAAEFGVDRRVVTGVDVRRVAWDEDGCGWTVESADGRSWTADAVILATGQLNQPAYPRIEGRQDFAGHAFHSARWDHDYDLSGQRVAVIGTGASAVQFVPEIAAVVDELTVFQRSANWFLPRDHDLYPRWERAAIRHVPGLQALRRRLLYRYGEMLTAMIRHPGSLGRVGARASSSFMRRQLPDPELRAKAWPDYTFGCKRVLFSSEFLPALARPNVQLVTDPITRMTATGPVCGDRAYDVDCVIYATGFRTNDFMLPMDVVGAGGVTLAEAWAGGPHAYLGVAVPGFPSLFMMYGPNTNTSGGSIIVYEEAQASYIRQALDYIRAQRAAAVEVKAEIEAAYDCTTQERFTGTAWKDCDSWYRNRDGRIVANWPGYMHEYERRLRTFDPAAYVLIPSRSPARTSETIPA